MTAGRRAAMHSAGRLLWIGTATRVTGVMALAGYGLADDYRPAHAFVAIAAAVVAGTLLAGGRWWGAGAGFGGGLLLFAGAVLAHEPWGVLALVAGLASCVATIAAVPGGRRGGVPAVVGAFLGAPATAVLVAFVAFTVEG